MFWWVVGGRELGGWKECRRVMEDFLMGTLLTVRVFRPILLLLQRFHRGLGRADGMRECGQWSLCLTDMVVYRLAGVQGGLHRA